MYPIDVTELTVGDRIMLSHGEKIPCDCLIVDADEFSVADSANRVVKSAANANSSTFISSKTVCFSGTTCVSGSAYAIVLAVGTKTTEALAKKQAAE